MSPPMSRLPSPSFHMAAVVSGKRGLRVQHSDRGAKEVTNSECGAGREDPLPRFVCAITSVRLDLAIPVGYVDAWSSSGFKAGCASACSAPGLSSTCSNAFSTSSAFQISLTVASG